MSTDILAPQQMRHLQLLKDPIYRKWFAKPPYVPPGSRAGRPWYLYLQEEQDGRWQRAGMATYASAYKWIGKRLGDYWDFSITSRRKCYLPPVYRPRIDGEPGKHKIYWVSYPQTHSWCPYCRRPTIFGSFSKHHAITPIYSSLGFSNNGEPVSRCTVCGIRGESVSAWLRLGR